MMRPISPAACVVLLLCAGCSSSNVTIPAWQRELERYVKDRGGGDPTVLRDVTIPGGRAGFAFIGDPDPTKGDDVTGLLLGNRVINGKPWVIYLIGQLQKQRVTQIRVAALTVNSGRFNWRLGSPNRSAFEQYAGYAEKQWRARFPSRADAPPQYLGFPRPDDAFDLAVTQDHVVATHRQSGADWELWIGGKAHPVSPAPAPAPTPAPAAR
jgi:hypothetical protein